LRRHGRSLHQALTNWLEVAPCRVVNRSRPNGSNMSKPYQAQLILELQQAIVAGASEPGP